MIDLLLFCIAVVGLTDIVVDSRIKELVINSWWYRPIRWVSAKVLPSYVYEALECHQCMGFWFGLLTGYFLLGNGWITVLACGFGGSFLSKLFGNIMACLDVWYMNNMHTEIEINEKE